MPEIQSLNRNQESIDVDYNPPAAEDEEPSTEAKFSPVFFHHRSKDIAVLDQKTVYEEEPSPMFSPIKATGSRLAAQHSRQEIDTLPPPPAPSSPLPSIGELFSENGPVSGPSSAPSVSICKIPTAMELLSVTLNKSVPDPRLARKKRDDVGAGELLLVPSWAAASTQGRAVYGGNQVIVDIDMFHVEDRNNNDDVVVLD